MEVFIQDAVQTVLATFALVEMRNIASPATLRWLPAERIYLLLETASPEASDGSTGRTG